MTDIDTKALALRVAGPNTLCPFCGAYSRRSCELEEEMGSCPWEDSEPDPDILRDDANERARLRKEYPDDE
ncbi:hypothetical protein [Xanthobacter flavus]|uniref:hypothetical protein n=1 Tax=Xanthobacter flavus TaxID=281 RepID=UPI003727F25C